jgi:hypothetical protein
MVGAGFRVRRLRHRLITNGAYGAETAWLAPLVVAPCAGTCPLEGVEFCGEFAFGVWYCGACVNEFTGAVELFCVAAGAVLAVGGFTTPLLGVEANAAFAVCG